MRAAKKSTSIDPITFEVLKNRLWAINDEQANIALRTAGTLIVYDVRDMNAAITDRDGRGMYLACMNNTLAVTVQMGVKSILANFSRDFIREGDMFLFNDPWQGSVHYNDFTMVAPVFFQGDIVAWSGVSMHEVDVGGQTPGSMFPMAKSAYEEPAIVPLVKVVEGWEVQQDIIKLACRTSRLPQLLELNILARMSAIRSANKAIHALVEQYGKETFLAFTGQLIEHIRDSIIDRLRKIPDGTWYDNHYVEHDGINDIIYQLKLAMTKKGDKLTFDFTGTSPQAPGFINCALSLLHSSVALVFLSMLGYGLPYSVGALEQLYDVIAPEGSLVNASFPAPVALGAIGVAWGVKIMANDCVGKMMACSAELKDFAMADYASVWNGVLVAGVDQAYKEFTDAITEPGGGGAGAHSNKDGLDSGGTIDIPGQGIPDVESSEYNYPLLTLWRRESKDASGPGKFRGGTGIEYAMVPYKVPFPVMLIVVTASQYQPGAMGICGGLPANVQFNAVLKNTHIWEKFKAGEVPVGLTEIGGEMDVRPVKSMGALASDEVLFAVMSGGGGYSDPLLRDPELVSKDIKAGLCSMEVARDIFGVIVDPVTLKIDKAATEKMREEIVHKRIVEGRPVGEVLAGEKQSEK
ncbi:MAG: hydantoinase B/oxoprolinase family protein [Dehalococcoidia bacterium]|jgi:N-methylhydantoinase B